MQTCERPHSRIHPTLNMSKCSASIHSRVNGTPTHLPSVITIPVRKPFPVSVRTVGCSVRPDRSKVVQRAGAVKQAGCGQREEEPTAELAAWRGRHRGERCVCEVYTL
jgi:hypothetical protein